MIIKTEEKIALIVVKINNKIIIPVKIRISEIKIINAEKNLPKYYTHQYFLKVLKNSFQDGMYKVDLYKY